MTRRRTLPAIALVLLLASCRRETPGSAPVRAVGDHAVIGDTPAAFRFDEPIVVQDATKGGLTQYYDAAAAGLQFTHRPHPKESSCANRVCSRHSSV